MRKIQDINSGSMADIAFLLLVFFLVTASISQDFGIKTQISKPFGVPDSVQIVQSYVWVNSAGHYKVNDTRVNHEELETQLARSLSPVKNIKNVIIVKADREVNFDDFISALDRSKKSIKIFYDKVANEEYGTDYTQLSNSIKRRIQHQHSVVIAEDVLQ